MRHFVIGLFLFSVLASPAAAVHEEVPPSGKALSEESLDYDISFLWFDRLAEGRLSFTEGDRPGTYLAVLEAKTRGVAARLSGNRAQKYISLMEKREDGTLRAISHESHIMRGRFGNQRQARTKRYIFDYDRGQVLYQRYREGRLTAEQIIHVDRVDPPADMLTALYNFRNGVYGLPTAEEPIVVPAFNHRGDSEIVVEIVPESEREDYPFPTTYGQVCRITLDPEIFDTGGGSVYVWFNEQGLPAGGLVENVLGMGNVQGTIR